MITDATSLKQLAEKIREINKANGWNITVESDWEDLYKFPAIIGLIHSEVSESHLALFSNDARDLEDELADINIRILDCVGGLPVDIDEAWKEAQRGGMFEFESRWIDLLEINRGNDEVTTAAALAAVSINVSRALEDFRKNKGQLMFVCHLMVAFSMVEIICSLLGIDLARAMSDKIEKNKTRGYRHGGKKV